LTRDATNLPPPGGFAAPRRRPRTPDCDPGSLPATCDTANFLADDPGCLVEASLACPRCLATARPATLELDAYDACVECVCHECGHSRTVFLTSEQALRLSLHVDRPLDPAPRMPGLGLAI
jgi:hypothetical protein